MAHHRWTCRSSGGSLAAGWAKVPHWWFTPVSGPGQTLMISSFERCLTEPVANRPDDVLEGVLVRFLQNLKPGLRNLEYVDPPMWR